jgi:hypothetical protein
VELEQTMTTVVRYQVKPERAEENQRLIEAVFAELEERAPEGFTYKVFRLDDGEVPPVATGATVVGGYRWPPRCPPAG